MPEQHDGNRRPLEHSLPIDAINDLGIGIRCGLRQSRPGAAGNNELIPRIAYSQPWAASLRYRDFRLFWVSTLFYSLGMGMERVAVGWLVFEITDSAFMVGVAAALLGE